MKYFQPHDHVDCGPTCLRMIANHYGRHFSSRFLQKQAHISKHGVSLSNLATAAEKIGLKAVAARLTINYLLENAALPCILYWDKGHFVVLYKIKTKRRIFSNKKKAIFHIADPGRGKVKLSEEVFRKYWLSDNDRGFGLFLEPKSDFHTLNHNDVQDEKPSKSVFRFLYRYFNRYRKNYAQVFISILISGFVTLLFPFLTQSIIDVGIEQKNVSFIVALLVAQLTLFLAGVLTEVIRSQLLLHIGSRINLSIFSDFLSKLLKLSISFYDSKIAGDIMERISDHKRVEQFITSTLLTSFFSVVNLIVYSFVLGAYSIKILLVFFVGSFLSIQWTLLFMRWRRSLDYRRFRDYASSHDQLYELVNGISEIKLNSFEEQIRWKLEELQVKLFRIDLSNLKLEQYQQIGSDFFTQLKNIAITFIAAYSVIQGEITLGMMLAIAYIMGQLNVPIKQFIQLVNTAQSTQIGVERMNEIYLEPDEEAESVVGLTANNKKLVKFPGLQIKDLSFRYGGEESELVLNNINLYIPKGKVTAIVGSSGSGKTTLIKLLLKFYTPTKGSIFLDDRNLEVISSKWWRQKCGTVMQEGYIFSDSIKNNIVMGDYDNDKIESVIQAVETANIDEFIASLPLHFETKVGNAGIGLSTGQKQRLLIARAVFKNPEYIFFDEATSSLDARNEKVIMDNLNKFFKGKTVVVVAHRLSTVKNADQIVVLEKGEIVEIGTHHELVDKQGGYYNLIKNQLEIGA